MSMKSVLGNVLAEISVSSEAVAEIRNLAEDFISVLKKKGLIAFIGGSLAKGTLIKKKSQDVDIFVVFDSEEEIGSLGKILSKVKLPGNLKQVHGSRDYFQVDCGKVVLEIIPVVKNDDPELAKNVTDVSLSHVKYVVGELKKNSDLADEIKLAKAFCQANRVYGAESYVRGFSGYSLEVLVIHFGSFVNFLKKVSGKKVIDPKKYFRNEAEIRREINYSKIQGPLVVVDPTFKYRNVCAGLGAETFDRFVLIAKDFLKKPSEDFFEKKPFDSSDLKSFAEKKKAKLFSFDLSTDRQEGDIAGTKMRKIFDFFVSELGRKKQEVLKTDFDYSGSGRKANGYLVLKEVPEIEIRGPSLKMKSACDAFKKSRKKTFEKKGYLWAPEKVSVKDVLKSVQKVEKEIGASINS